MPNPTVQTLYEVAQERIGRGDWTADPESGQIFGTRGRPFTARSVGGYVCCKPITHGASALVHRIIWELVNGPIPAGREINHLNGIKTDNRICNLEAVTHAENMMHAYVTGLMKLPPRRPRSMSCAMHGAVPMRIRRDGSRWECRECKRIDMARRRAAAAA